MQRLWRFLMRKRRPKPAHIPYFVMAAVVIGTLGWAAWNEFDTPAQQISLTSLVRDAGNGLITSASLTENRIDVVYSSGVEAEFRGHLPDETLVQLVHAGVDVSFA